MPSNSKSNRRKKKKSKFVQKQKQQLQVKQPTRNWLELPPGLMVNILQRVGANDILENAQKVCTAWREICKDPALWSVISIGRFSFLCDKLPLQEMCKHAVDRSQGQLVDLTIIGYCNPELLQYVADRSSQLRRLGILWSFNEICGKWSEALKKLSLLEELNLFSTNISQQDIEAVGRYCPLLKTLKLNQKPYLGFMGGKGDNEVALAIGKHLPELTHLQLIQNCMTNIGLEAILDGCRHLESLDLRGYLYLDLKGDLGKRCSQQINCLKLHFDSVEASPSDVLDDSDDEYDGDFDYDLDRANLENLMLG